MVLANHKRIGLLIPSSNTVMEVDFYRHLPPDVTLHTSRMYMEDTSVEGESRMLDECVLPAARDLATAHPHLVVFGCTSAGALRGSQYEGQLCRRLEDITGVPTLSVMQSVREAAIMEGVKRIAVITPYVDALNKRLQSSLEEQGMRVVAIHGLSIATNYAIGQVDPKDIVEFARQRLRNVAADLVFTSCTNFRAMEALPALRDLFPVPVWCSNQVVLEGALRVLFG